MSKKENMFDIKNKNYEKKKYTDDNIKSLLIGYVEVPISEWSSINIDKHIRYFKKDGSFVRGGFVISHSPSGIQIANNLNRQSAGYTTWFAANSSLQRIFKKIDTISSTENQPANQLANQPAQNEINDLKSKQIDIIKQVNKLIDLVKHQKNKIDSHEADIKRIMSIVKNN